MKALFLNATLKRSPDPSSTGALNEYVGEQLASHDVEVEHVRLAPTWLGQPSSIVKRVLERLDALLSETSDDGTPAAFNKVAGFVVVGNEDGAHHCIAEMAGAAIDIGFTVPGQAWTYWNKGPGPGEEEYLNTDDKKWTHTTGDAMAHILAHSAHSARPLAATPIPKPPNA